MSEIYIYALVDPRDDQTKYIGQTINPDFRLNSHKKNIAHFNSGSSYKAAWTKELWQLGLEPKMKILKTVTSEEANTVEQETIKEYREKGILLLNTAFNKEGLKELKSIRQLEMFKVFVSERLIKSPKSVLTIREFYKAYGHWWLDTPDYGTPVMTKTQFVKTLSAENFLEPGIKRPTLYSKLSGWEIKGRN